MKQGTSSEFSAKFVVDEMETRALARLVEWEAWSLSAEALRRVDLPSFIHVCQSSLSASVAYLSSDILSHALRHESLSFARFRRRPGDTRRKLGPAGPEARLYVRDRPHPLRCNYARRS